MNTILFRNVSGSYLQKQLSLTKGMPPRCASKTRRRVVGALPFLLTVLAVVPTGCGANADLHKLLGEVQRQYNRDPAGAIARLARVETETPHPGVSMLLGKLHFERLAWVSTRRSRSRRHALFLVHVQCLRLPLCSDGRRPQACPPHPTSSLATPVII